MKRLAALSLAALAACNQPQRQEGDQPVTKSDVDRAVTNLAAKYDQAYLTVVQLQERVMQLESRVVALENEAKVKDVDIRALNDKVARLMAEAGNAGPDGAAGPGARPEEVQKEIEKQIQRLKDGLRKEDVAKALVPVAKYAAPRLCDALRGAVRDVELMKRIEYVLAQMPPADLRAPLEDALKDPVARYPAARVVGDVGNRELSSILEPYTSDPGLDFCFLVGDAMVRCRNPRGVPALFRSMRADDSTLRMLSVNVLRRLNGDDALGYDFTKSPAENAAAIKAWEEWFDKAGATLFK